MISNCLNRKKIDVTAIINHYEDNMKEYPKGSTLILKEIKDSSQIIWGCNYCIETEDICIIRKLQAGTDDYLMAYSTNTDKYPDGHLVHEPFPVYKDTIKRVFKVVGCIRLECNTRPMIINSSVLNSY